jgi:hypothetical protein
MTIPLTQHPQDLIDAGLLDSIHTDLSSCTLLFVTALKSVHLQVILI